MADALSVSDHHGSTKEDKLLENHLNRLFMHCPYGSLGDAIEDIQKIVDRKLSLKDIPEIVHRYNLDNQIWISFPEKRIETLLTPRNTIRNNVYYCPRTGKTFSFDAITNTVEILGSLKETGTKNECGLQEFLVDELNKYVGKMFIDGKLEVFVIGEKVDIFISVFVDKNRKYRNGQRITNWEIHMKSCKAYGSIRARSHIYEDGNIQMQASQTYTKRVDSPIFSIISGADTCIRENKSIVSFVKKLTKMIQECDETFCTNTSDCSESMINTKLSNARRILPRTKSTINWERVVAEKIARYKP